MNNNEIEKKLDQLLSNLPKQQYDTDAWLMEDETEAFENIVRQRRRKTWLRRLAAAAAVVGVLFWAGSMLNRQQEEPQPLAVDETRQTPVQAPQPINTQTLAEAMPEKKATPRTKVQKAKETVANKAAAQRMTPIDSLADIVAHIEQSMQGIKDSCYLANVEKLIRADNKLQRLVNELILEGIMTGSTKRVVYHIERQNNEQEYETIF